MSNFTVSFTGHYIRNEIPPRCRKPRPVRHPMTAQVEIDTVTAADAPIAVRVDEVSGRREIRLHDGRLFTLHLPFSRQSEPTRPGSVQFPEDIGWLTLHASSEEEFHAQAAAHFRQFVIVDDIVYIETPEPCYEVCSFGGMSGNVTILPSESSRAGILFRADEFDAAHEYAITLASRRGVTRSVDRLRGEPEQYRRIEVLIPEAITLVPVPPAPMDVEDLRIEYAIARGRLAQARTPDDEAVQFAELVRIREEIIKRGHLPLESDLAPYEARHGLAADQ